jgi:y4mF family transcriptional regulator
VLDAERDNLKGDKTNYPVRYNLYPYGCNHPVRYNFLIFGIILPYGRITIAMITIQTAKQFGEAIRRSRKAQGLNQTMLAGLSGAGVRFVSELERGKPTCELEKALQIATMLGIRLTAALPEQEQND